MCFKEQEMMQNRKLREKTLLHNIKAEQVYTQFCVYLYLCQRKCNHMYAINHVYI